MKRLLCALLLALFVGGILGCGKEEPTEKPPETKEPETSTTTEGSD